MKDLEEKLGYQFQNPVLLENALTHSSYANEHKEKGMPSNERLEFLGDSILGMVTADYLFREHPGLQEGELTRIRASLVCERSLYQV
ncbi:MAG: ribonuclease III, partial [Oscillospiraceae bacterium]|nr:ribonuclease III [Oscillospiraceae bacterium]